MDNYNYPMGADTKDAPWNQVDNLESVIALRLIRENNLEVNIKRRKKVDYEL